MAETRVLGKPLGSRLSAVKLRLGVGQADHGLSLAGLTGRLTPISSSFASRITKAVNSSTVRNDPDRAESMCSSLPQNWPFTRSQSGRNWMTKSRCTTSSEYQSVPPELLGNG